MDIKEAEKLADEFPEWVGNFLKGSAKGAIQPIRWFIQTLYEKDYMIVKKLKDKDIDETLNGTDLKSRQSRQENDDRE